MATEAQINANRSNANHSTGAQTQEGREASARNAITKGLYTFNDFVLPEEADIYQLFVADMHRSCDASDAIEQCLAAEIASHSTLDPLIDTLLVKEIRSIERARTHSRAEARTQTRAATPDTGRKIPQ